MPAYTEINNIIEHIEQILEKRNLSQHKTAFVRSKLQAIKDREKDENLYLGIVGEFSGGKSTLMNALIAADFFSTNAIQGTTTIPTYLKYSEKIGLKVFDFAGKKSEYSKNKKKLLKNYIPDIYYSLSSWKRFWISVKDFFGINGFDDQFLPLFDYLTTNDELSDYLSEVYIEYPAGILKNGLVIIDTPGTDSLNKKHIEITEKTISEKCDLALVIIPGEKPLSTTLVDFLKRNLPASLHRCQYFITKVELLKNQNERNRLFEGIKQRMLASLSLQEINLIHAPTLLYLEENNIIEKSGLTEHISDTDKSIMATTFKQDMINMVTLLMDSKEIAIKEKLLLVINNIISDLSVEFAEKEALLKEELRILRQLQTKPLSVYISEFFSSWELNKQYYAINHDMRLRYSAATEKLLSHVNYQIRTATTKDETQGVMDSESTKRMGEECCKDCFDAFVHHLHSLKKQYMAVFEDFKINFTKEFSISAVGFIFSIKMKQSWEKKYKICFDKDPLTTFLLIRAFKKLDTIKNEMQEAVVPCVNDAFDKIYNSYSILITHVNQDLDQQMHKVKSIFFSKYSKIINRRIQEEKIREHRLNKQIAFLQTDIQYLDGKKNLLLNQNKPAANGQFNNYEKKNPVNTGISCKE
ncbi:MAG: dynamin family protein [Candidatus Azobacteroides sp.]|nr:dynamin family protein [Candidatus Azobacteroides sp.]